MAPELKAKIIAALRSGDYKPAYYKLRVKEGDGYCYCWAGVVCDVVDPNGWVPSATDGSTVFGWKVPGHTGYPGIDWLAEIGLDSKVVDDYISLSDNHVSFAQLADQMESDDRF